MASSVVWTSPDGAGKSQYAVHFVLTDGSGEAMEIQIVPGSDPFRVIDFQDDVLASAALTSSLDTVIGISTVRYDVTSY